MSAAEPQKIECVILCDSEPKDVPGLESTIDRMCITFPNGIENHKTHQLRLGDYFSEINFTPNEIIFRVKIGASSDWKYLVVATMQKLKEKGINSSIKLSYTMDKHEQEPTIS